MKLIIRLLANIVGLWLAVQLVVGFQVSGGWKGYLIAGVLVALLNLLVKPILRTITLPLIVITLGLFGLVVNALLLWLAGQFIPGYIVITDLAALLWATVVLTLANLLSDLLT